MATVTLKTSESPRGYFILHNESSGEESLIQRDWDFPAVAAVFGWDISDAEPLTCGDSHCDADADGGVSRCPCCGTPAIEFIGQAQEYLVRHVGTQVEDPGLFRSYKEEK